MSKLPPTTLQLFFSWMHFLFLVDVATLPQLQNVIQDTSVVCVMCQTQQIRNSQSLQKNFSRNTFDRFRWVGDGECDLRGEPKNPSVGHMAALCLYSLEKRWKQMPDQKHHVSGSLLSHLFSLWYTSFICVLPTVDCFHTYSSENI